MKFSAMKLGGATVMVIGGGSAAYQTARRFVDSDATIWVISKNFTEEIQKLGETRKVALLKTEVKDAKAFVDSLNPKPYVLIVATGNSKLDSELVQSAKQYGSLTYSADNPALQDFTLP